MFMLTNINHKCFSGLTNLIQYLESTIKKKQTHKNRFITFSLHFKNVSGYLFEQNHNFVIGKVLKIVLYCSLLC